MTRTSRLPKTEVFNINNVNKSILNISFIVRSMSAAPYPAFFFWNGAALKILKPVSENCAFPGFMLIKFNPRWTVLTKNWTLWEINGPFWLKSGILYPLMKTYNEHHTQP